MTYKSGIKHGFMYLLLIVLLGSCNKIEIVQSYNDLHNKIEYDLEYDTILYKNEMTIVLNPYKSKGKLTLKGAMHTHTDNSVNVDSYGSGEPKWVAEKLRDEGNYDFYAFTDHNYVTSNPEVEGIVWMGYAVEDTKISQHICAYNLPFNEFHDKGNYIQDILDYYHSINAFTCLSHPNNPKTYITEEILAGIDNLTFIEVMNYGDLQNFRCLDILRTANVRTLALGVDDFHYNESLEDPNMFFNKSWINVFADYKEKDNIWKAILKGAFYVTNGPEINISFNNGLFEIYTPQLSDIIFIWYNNIEEKIDTIEYSDVFKASYSWENEIKWVRAKVSNNKGIAYTQYIQEVNKIIFE
jgi:hypothetical protein